MIMQVTTRLTHKYLMNKGKSELAYFALEQADILEKLQREAVCPCCDDGKTLTGICQECHGKALASVAYDTLRTQYKTLHVAQLQLANHCESIKNALRDALDVVEVCAGWLRNAEGNTGDPSNEDAAKACDECVAYARSLGVRRNCPGKDSTCPCQDGDSCHYEGPNAWPIPELTK